MESSMVKPTSDPSDGMPFKPGLYRPASSEGRQPLVEQGDFAEIYRLILENPWHEIRHADAFSQLFRAIDVASRKDPAKLSAEFFRMMLNVAGYLTLRVQYTLLQRVQSTDTHNHRGPSEIESDVLDSVLGPLMSMHSHLAELCQSQAASARLWQLAREKELKNDRCRCNGLETRRSKSERKGAQTHRLNGCTAAPASDGEASIQVPADSGKREQGKEASES
jgi:hypothetical protein